MTKITRARYSRLRKAMAPSWMAALQSPHALVARVSFFDALRQDIRKNQSRNAQQRRQVEQMFKTHIHPPYIDSKKIPQLGSARLEYLRREERSQGINGQ